MKDWREELRERKRRIRRRSQQQEAAPPRPPKEEAMPNQSATPHALADEVHTIIEQQLPRLTDAVNAAGRAGSLTLKIDLKPDKELPDRYELLVTPKLALPGVGAEWGAKIEVVKGEAQLSLMSAFESAA